MQLKDELAEQVGRMRARGVVIDVSNLDVMDSFATRTLRRNCRDDQIARRRDGHRGNPARHRVRDGPARPTLDGIATALDLDGRPGGVARRDEEEAPGAR